MIIMAGRAQKDCHAHITREKGTPGSWYSSQRSAQTARPPTRGTSEEPARAHGSEQAECTHEHRAGTQAQRRGEVGPAWHGQIHGGTATAAPATPARGQSRASGRSRQNPPPTLGTAARRALAKDAHAAARCTLRGPVGARTEQDAQQR
jgi:hypothetical protein